MRSATWTLLAGLWVVLSVTAVDARDRVYYYHNDHLGTPQALSNAAGEKVWEAEYEPFGKATVNEDPDGDGISVINNLSFPGQYYAAETGLHYNYHRDYQPETGRYLEPDPIGAYGLAMLSFTAKDPINFADGDTNLYAYVMSDPVNFVDPSGLYGYGPHLYVPIQAAAEAGMPTEIGRLLGLVSHSVDLIHNGMEYKNRGYHFSTTDQARARVKSACTIPELGEAVHTLMDSYSHEGLGFFTAGQVHVWQSLFVDAWDPNSERDRLMYSSVRAAISSWMKDHPGYSR